MVKLADSEKERQLRKLHQLAGNSIVNSMTSQQFQETGNNVGLNPHTLLSPTAAILNTAALTSNHHHHHHLANPVINPFINSFTQYATHPSQSYPQNEFDFSTNHHLTPNPNVGLPALGHHSLINSTAAFLASPLMAASLTNNGLLAPVSSIAAAASSGSNFFFLIFIVFFSIPLSLPIIKKKVQRRLV